MNASFVAASLVSLSLLTPAVSRASDEGVAPAPSSVPSKPAAPAEATETWYGGPILALDGVAAGLMVAGSLAGHDLGRALGTTGFLTYAVAPAIVHTVHGSAGRGLGSIGLRVGLPTIAVAILLARNGLDGDGGRIGPQLFLVGSLAGAIALDVSLLAWKRPVTVAPLAGQGTMGIRVGAAF